MSNDNEQPMGLGASLVLVALIYSVTLLIYQCNNVPEKVKLEQLKNERIADSTKTAVGTNEYCSQVGMETCFNTYLELLSHNCRTGSTENYQTCMNSVLKDLDTTKIKFLINRH